MLEGEGEWRWVSGRGEWLTWVPPQSAMEAEYSGYCAHEDDHEHLPHTQHTHPTPTPITPWVPTYLGDWDHDGVGRRGDRGANAHLRGNINLRVCVHILGRMYI